MNIVIIDAGIATSYAVVSILMFESRLELAPNSKR